MKRSVVFGASILGLSLSSLVFTSGCTTDAFCWDCNATPSGSGSGSGTGGTGGMGGDGGEGGLILVGSGGSGGCNADVLTDPQNCGACGVVCNLPNAFSTCEAGFCVVDTCASGFVDLDNQVANGCEYKCTVSNNGDEICDTIDNDCNGAIDELTDLQGDPFNCGACNAVCAYANASPSCVAGTCQLAECLVGYHDVNGTLGDGCEYACTETNGGVELCDYADNDCDATVDEGFDVQTDPANCGTCGTNCSALYPNSVGTCTAGVCAFGPCLPGHYNLDGIEANGCEYACTPSGAETCDGADNDCNGLVDDGALPGVGASCGTSDVGECALGTQACQGGMLACVGAIGPGTELCDGLDNDCSGGADEACPVAKATDTRLDLGANSAVGQAPSTQLSVASRGDVVIAAYLDRRAGNADIRANVSTNGGSTWLATDAGVASGTLTQVEPWAFLSPTRAYVALAQFPSAAHRDVYIASAPAPYNTYTVPVRVDKDAGTADAFFVRGVVAKAGAQDTLVVVWQSLSGTGASVTTDVFLQRSTNGGTTWLAADLRVNGAQGKAELPAIATDDNGKVFLAWRDARNGKSEVYGAVYNAETGTLGANVALSGGNPAEQITVAADAGGPNVYVAWTDLRGAKKVIRQNRSNDAGVTFQPDGAVVNVDSTFADASAPAIVSAGGRVVIAWEDTRSGLPDIRLNHSTNGGVTWQPTSARADLATIPGTSASTRPRVALGGASLVFVTWEDARSGQRDIFANHSFDNGATFQPLDLRMDVGMAGAPSAAGAADSRNPFVVTNAAGARAITIWTDNRTTAGTNGANADIYTSFFE
ncbi:MopE-related protein [Polyangium fumosum]|uniref:Exo-alpha-sialidase n=1 Tax=Polyangium fumosum TaxID=889272 RepID=A0A4U1J3C2_9BACT|nr:MopE-related protein [Polyangium fumosum]TKD01656.1 hypothetical protein E8A74_30380 [Polyangium fumosum]